MNKKMNKPVVIIASLVLVLITSLVAASAAEKKNRTNYDIDYNNSDEVSELQEQQAKEISVPIEIFKPDYIEFYSVTDSLKLKVKEFTEKSSGNPVSLSGKKASVRKQQDSVWSEILIKNGDSIKTVSLDNELFTAVYSINWSDEDTLEIVCHVNPSMDVMLIYSEENGLTKYYGAFFTKNVDNKLYYVETAPHFGTEKVPEKLLDSENNVYYQTEKGVKFNSDIAVCGDYIAFYESDGESTTLKVINVKEKSVVFSQKNAVEGELVFE